MCIFVAVYLILFSYVLFMLMAAAELSWHLALRRIVILV